MTIWLLAASLPLALAVTEIRVVPTRILLLQQAQTSRNRENLNECSWTGEFIRILGEHGAGIVLRHSPLGISFRHCFSRVDVAALPPASRDWTSLRFLVVHRVSISLSVLAKS